MKAITLHEPWAALIAHGWKEVETREWYTSYRGPLAIHAGLRKPDPADVSRFTFLLGHRGFELPPLTFGAVVCVCHLAACVPTALVGVASGKLHPAFRPKHGWDVELQMGNYDKGRWAWILRDVQRLEHPLAAKGQRKLWNCLLGGLPEIHTRMDAQGVSTAPAVSSQDAKAGV